MPENNFDVPNLLLKRDRSKTQRLRVYETILATTDDFVYIFDPQGRFLYANARLLEVWAQTLHQVIGKTCYDLGYPTWHADMHMREIEEIVRTKKQIRGEVPFTGASGISGIYDYIFKPVLDPSGNVEFIVGTTRDVTERHQAHANAEFLAGLTEKLSVVSNAAEINLIATRETGQFLRAERCFCFEVLPGGERVRVLPDWHAEGESGVAGEYTFADFGTFEWTEAFRNGNVSIEDVRTHPWTKSFAAGYESFRIRAYTFSPFVHEGKWVACIGVASDQPRCWSDEEKALLENAAARVWPLIERANIEGALRESEERLRHANEQLADRATHLETIVQQRTSRLSETIGELEAFSYSISHDMRSPLRSMIGFAEMLKEDYGAKLDATGIDYLERISAASRRMDRLIQDVLNFSRIGGQGVVLEPVDPENLIRDVIRSYPNLHSAEVTISISSPLPKVKANEALLTQCVSNLLENAVKFVAPGKIPHIEVSARKSEGRTRLFFKDNGIGVPAHSLEKIFDIFHRVGRDKDGTGIGLAIVRKAAEKMGGSVGVVSEPGQGSLFWLDLESV